VSPDHTGALEAVDRILNRGGAPEAVLRAVAAALHERLFAAVAIGPPAEAPLRVAIHPGLELQATPRAPSPDDLPLLERVAVLVSAHAACLRVGASPVRCPT
jgi:hypothetical protein